MPGPAGKSKIQVGEAGSSFIPSSVSKVRATPRCLGRTLIHMARVKVKMILTFIKDGKADFVRDGWGFITGERLGLALNIRKRGNS
jgi:hypothetical protein